MRSIPSKLLKIWSTATRWLLGLVLLAWLLLGLAWGALHWWIVPRIDTFRPYLQAQASQALGLQVHMARLATRSNGVMPVFELHEVSLQDAQAREVLRLPKVTVSVSVRSLWRLGFEQIYIEDAQLDVRRHKDGRISVAGLTLADTVAEGSAAQNWFFSQIELALHGGLVRWTDETRAADPVWLQHVNLVVRNRGRHHDVRLDATPPALWGERFSVRGRFMQPLLTQQNGHWQAWDGQVYAFFERIDVSELRQYVSMGVDVRQGRGALRAWVDVTQGQSTGVTLDMALNAVDVTLGPDLPALNLHQVQGRLAGQTRAGGFEVRTQGLTFQTIDGLTWPASPLHVLHRAAAGSVPASSEFQADRLDLAVLAQLLQRLPVPDLWRDTLQPYAPQGVVEQLALTWQGSPQAPQRYSVKGRVSALALAAVGNQPGVRGLAADFEFDQHAGKAQLRLTPGAVAWPSVLSEPWLALSQLTAQLRWQVSGDHWAVQARDVRFANADTQGTAQINWQTSDPATAPNHRRFPGVIDLQAKLDRLDGTQVHRYLPLVIDARARNYVREAVIAGQASNVRFVVQGDISQLPQPDPRHGQFRISADVQHAALAYVPRSLQAATEPPWPTLTDVQGQLLIDGLQLHVKGASAKVAQAPSVQISAAEVTIADLLHTTVNVKAKLKGLLPEALQTLNASPLSALIDDALKQAKTSGAVDASLTLSLPVAQLSQSTVQGSVVFNGNELQIMPAAPRLSRLRGQLDVSQTGFTVKGVQARLLGGDARLEGGLVFAAPSAVTRSAPTTLLVSGIATAAGLQQASELGLLSGLAHHTSGSAAYTASFSLRQGHPELLIQSTLQGMALNLPAPLQKDAATALPLRFNSEWLNPRPTVEAVTPPGVERFTLSLAGLGRAMVERDVSSSPARVLRGGLELGPDLSPTPVWPAQGVAAQVQLPKVDVDAWQALVAPLAQAQGVGVEAMAYVPTRLALRTDVLRLGGRELHQLVATGSRDGNAWRAHLDAQELSGDVEFRPTAGTGADNQAGRVSARLKRLSLAPSVVTDVEALLDAQPASLPALDIVVEDFELRGKHVGRLDVQAINRMANATPTSPGVPEWRLNQFNLTVPEATLTATGNWVRLNAPQTVGATQPNGAAVRRRTVLNFKLAVSDGGALLARLGMKDVVRHASGRLAGQVSWLGSPLKLDYPTLGGAFTVDLSAGQFLKADPGIAKLLGVLSLQALPRRLSLDFRDVFSAGFAFDFLRGDVSVAQGIAHTNNLQMKGVNAAVLMEGVADIDQETQDLKVVVVPELNAGTASLIATVMNPAFGLGSFLAQLFLRRPLIESTTQQLHVTGSWIDPQVTQVSRPPMSNKETQP